MPQKITRSYKNSTFIFVTLMAALYLPCPQEQRSISEAWWEIQIKASLLTLLISMNLSCFTFWWHGHSAYSTLLCDCMQKGTGKVTEYTYSVYILWPMPVVFLLLSMYKLLLHKNGDTSCTVHVLSSPFPSSSFDETRLEHYIQMTAWFFPQD